jgi:hypothetical protein
MAGKRHFGRVRQLPSGRWQARYTGPDGTDRPAPQTFARKRDAEAWLTRTEAEILAGSWLSPDAGAVKLSDYAERWVRERPRLRPRTPSCTWACCTATSFPRWAATTWHRSRCPLFGNGVQSASRLMWAR